MFLFTPWLSSGHQRHRRLDRSPPCASFHPLHMSEVVLEPATAAAAPSLAACVPGLRGAAPATEEQPDDPLLSSDLSSVDTFSGTSPDEDSSDDNQRQKRAKAKKRKAASAPAKAKRALRSPSPITSESSDDDPSADEDAQGQVRPGHKRYLPAGLYSSTFKTRPASDVAQAPKAASVEPHFSIEQPPTINQALEEAVEEEEPDSVAISDADESAVTELAPRANKRASSLAATTRFARNGLGQRQKAQKPAPAPTVKKPAKPVPDAPKATLPEDFKGPLFPLPTNYGEYVIEEKRDFKLPFDLHRDYRTSGAGRQKMLRRAGRGMRPSKYMTINQSPYSPLFFETLTIPADAQRTADWFPERHKMRSEIPAICQCPKGSACGNACINRLLQYFCSPKLCPAGSTCTNVPFTEKQPFRHVDGSSATKVFFTGNRGFGLKAVADIPKNAFIMEYRGLSPITFEREPQAYE